MDDLAGLDWSSQPNNNKPPPLNPASASASYLSAFKPASPPVVSGRSTPLSVQASGGLKNASSTGSKVPTKSSTPANDSFSGLVSFGSSHLTKNLSLQEQQKILLERKAKEAEERRKQFDAQFGVHDSQWDALSNGREGRNEAASPASPSGDQSTMGKKLSTSINKPFAALGSRPDQSATPSDDGDLLSAFSSAAPVDPSSHFPPPSVIGNERRTPGSMGLSSGNSADGALGVDDDDPFGLGRLPPARSGTEAKVASTDDDDDVLGLLGKPISELPPPKSPSPQIQQIPERDTTHQHGGEGPQDKAVAELVDMGFPAEKAKRALEQTPDGTDVQSAVSWLLNQAHEEAKQKARGGDRGGRTDDRARPGRTERQDSTDRRRRENDGDEAVPAWMRRQGRQSSSTRRREDSASPSNAEKDFSQYASEIGNTLFKSANSLWKTGQKTVQSAVAEFNHDLDPSQPKWMREAQLEARGRRQHAEQDSVDQVIEGVQGRREHESRVPKPTASDKQIADANITTEAMMLESGDARSHPHRHTRPKHEDLDRSGPSPVPSREALPGRPTPPPDRSTAPPRFLQHQQREISRPSSRLSRQAVEEQSAQAYISPARRKKATPKPSDPEPDLLFGDYPKNRQSPAPEPSRNPFKPRASTPLSKPSTPLPTRPKAPTRQIPSLTPSALSTSTAQREKGTEAYKRGDYTTAHTHYTNALSPLPSAHPITIILLCNRALTNLKVGDPKAAVADADQALTIIGPSLGEDEKISLTDSEPGKDMREFYGKALTRKAEALEQMEKWTDAGKVWQTAVEAGVGGATSIQGRNRCEKATSVKSAVPAASSARRPPPATKRAPVAPAKNIPAPSTSTTTNAEAVARLRAANAAAERADDEKFALMDGVDARLNAWKAGKQDNLRALLGSLDTVLWAEAGWKKVGMHELVVPGKVKVAYMRGIGKVHPDKLPQSATTEQKMISAAVFSTLNEAWDKFKTENGL
ncbi:MAG: hypothetical protein M1819_005710 [Sarea resinae]|nr:MAG: hypothetical protein M1819_005710 [Sarea resinae]